MLIAYHGKQEIKDKVIEQLKLHYEHDEIIKGVYWEKGRGCAVGCTVHSAKHADYETQLGIAEILARLEDVIFEALPLNLAKKWPLRFVTAIRPGADLSTIWPRFAMWLLTGPKYGVIQYAQSEQDTAIIQRVADYCASPDSVTDEQWAAAGATEAWAVAVVTEAAGVAAATWAAVGHRAYKKYRIAQADKLIQLSQEA